MNEAPRADAHSGDSAPGDERTSEDVTGGIQGYLIGIALAAALTLASFYVASGSSFVWPPAFPFALIALGIGQMVVHLVFFFHITSAPDNTNNVLALAFGILIVVLVIAGSLWIMASLHHDMPRIEDMIKMQR